MTTDSLEPATQVSLSVVCPVHNEASGLHAFYRRLKAVLTSLNGMTHEILFVDDGSSDDSYRILMAIAHQDVTVRVTRLSRNFGHQHAITCGIDRSCGEAVVVIDSDLQDPPEVIVQMVEAWKAGVDVAYGQRLQRKGESLFKTITAMSYYRLLNVLSDTPIPLDVGDFRLMSRRVVDVLKTMREENRYIRGLVTWVGFHQQSVPYERDPRFQGKSNYGLGQMIRLASSGITGFSEKPVRLATLFGFVISATALLFGLYVIVSRILHPEASIPGYATLATLVLLLSGVQLISVGVIGQYVALAFRQVKQRPLYVVMEDSRPQSNRV